MGKRARSGTGEKDESYYRERRGRKEQGEKRGRGEKVIRYLVRFQFCISRVKMSWRPVLTATSIRALLLALD